MSESVRGLETPPAVRAGVFTIGHSTLTMAEFVAALMPVAIDLVVDVRSFPRSRTNPQFNEEVLPESLAVAGIGYRHLSALGGRRRSQSAAPSPNTLWRNAAFRNFADYATTDAFRTGLEELRALAGEHRCALMCAEAVWWRCHRRIIADYLLAEGMTVAHIMSGHKVVAASITPGAQRLADGTLTYRAE